MYLEHKLREVEIMTYRFPKLVAHPSKLTLSSLWWGVFVFFVPRRSNSFIVVC
jgi:hypothetical protein